MDFVCVLFVCVGSPGSRAGFERGQVVRQVQGGTVSSGLTCLF